MARLYSYIDADSNTNLEDVGFFDKVLATIFQWFKESGNEAAANEKLSSLVSEDLLTLQADLTDFFDKALEPIRQGKKRSVQLRIDSVFVSVLPALLDSDRYKNIYNITILSWPKIDYKRKFFIELAFSAQ